MLFFILQRNSVENCFSPTGYFHSVPRAIAGPWNQRTICRIFTFIEETAEKQREINQIFVHWVGEETVSAGQGKPGWNMWNPFQSASRNKSFRIEIGFCYKYDRCIIFGIHIYVHIYVYSSPSSSTNKSSVIPNYQAIVSVSFLSPQTKVRYSSFFFPYKVVNRNEVHWELNAVLLVKYKYLWKLRTYILALW